MRILKKRSVPEELVAEEAILDKLVDKVSAPELMDKMFDAAAKATMRNTQKLAKELDIKLPKKAMKADEFDEFTKSLGESANLYARASMKAYAKQVKKADKAVRKEIRKTIRQDAINQKIDQIKNFFTKNSMLPDESLLDEEQKKQINGVLYTAAKESFSLIEDCETLVSDVNCPR